VCGTGVGVSARDKVAKAGRRFAVGRLLGPSVRGVVKPIGGRGPRAD
jgi:hypothetical protein